MKIQVSPGQLLVASPGLLDPNFSRTVVLLCDHSDEGSFGLVVNRPTPTPIGRFFPRLEEATDERVSQHPFFDGGPVEREDTSGSRINLLRRGEGDESLLSLHTVTRGVHLVGDIDAAVERLALGVEEPTVYRFFVGYAGWGNGQLESELAESSWIVQPASEELIFEVPPREMWPMLIRGLGGMYSLYAEMPSDPSLN